MHGQQLRLGPLAKLRQLPVRREAHHPGEHFLSGGELGQRQAQTEQRSVSSVLPVRLAGE
jgi:hypothetical protein